VLLRRGARTFVLRGRTSAHYRCAEIGANEIVGDGRARLLA
jgi:hypothetical protein